MFREVSSISKCTTFLGLHTPVHMAHTHIGPAEWPAIARLLKAGCSIRVNLLAHLERDTFSRGNPVRLRLLDIKLI